MITRIQKETKELPLPIIISFCSFVYSFFRLPCASITEARNNRELEYKDFVHIFGKRLYRQMSKINSESEEWCENNKIGDQSVRCSV